MASVAVKVTPTGNLAAAVYDMLELRVVTAIHRSEASPILTGINLLVLPSALRCTF